MENTFQTQDTVDGNMVPKGYKKVKWSDITHLVRRPDCLKHITDITRPAMSEEFYEKLQDAYFALGTGNLAVEMFQQSPEAQAVMTEAVNIYRKILIRYHVVHGVVNEAAAAYTKEHTLARLREADSALTAVIQILNVQSHRDRESEADALATRKSVRQAKDLVTHVSTLSKTHKQPQHDEQRRLQFVDQRQRVSKMHTAPEPLEFEKEPIHHDDGKKWKTVKLPHNAKARQDRPAKEKESKQVRFESTVEGAILSGIATKGLAYAGNAIKGAFGLSDTADAASVIQPSACNAALADLPHTVELLAFKKKHSAPDAKHVIQAVGNGSMSLLQRLQVPQLLETFTVNTSCEQTSALIGSVSISPQVPFKKVVLSDGIYSNNTVLSYFSEMYEMWRGALTYDIQVVATNFHQGQVFVSFSPNDEQPPPDITQYSGLISETIDVGSDMNQIEFTPPYVFEGDYIRMDPAYAANPNKVMRLPYTYGRLWVWLQNPFTAPNTVNPNIYVNVYVRASPNFQFSVPTQPRTQVRVGGIYQSDEGTAQPTQTTPKTAITNPGDEYTVQTADQPLVGTGQDGLADENPLDQCTTVETASTENVMARGYLVKTDVNWTTAHVQGAVVTQINLPSDLLSHQAFAARGLLDYHTFLRAGFSVTIQTTSQMQYNGQLIFVFLPEAWDQPTVSDILASCEQLPCAKVDVSRCKTAVINVPYNYFRRMVRVTEATASLGSIVGIVINPLLAPTGACSRLVMSVRVQMTKPYIGVKRIPHAQAKFLVKAQFQSDEKQTSSAETTGTHEEGKPIDAPKPVVVPKIPASNIAAKQTAATRNYDQRGRPVRSYIAPHMNVYDLVKRRQWMGNVMFDSNHLCQISVERTPYIARIMTTYGYWNGSLRVTATTATPTTQAVIAYFQPLWIDYPYQQPLLPGTIPDHDGHRPGGGEVFWKPNIQPFIEVELPYYATTPVRRTVQASAPTSGDTGSKGQQTGFGRIILTEDAPAGEPATDYVIMGSMGDDVEFYVPLPVPNTRVPMSTTTKKVLKEQFIPLDGVEVADIVPAKPLILSGDVEQNPGPTFIGGWVKRQIRDLVDEIANDQVDKAQRKIRELQVFLHKNVAVDSISDIVIPVLRTLLDVCLHIRLMLVDRSPITVVSCFTAIALNVYGVFSEAKGFLDRARECFEGILGITINDRTKDLLSEVDGGPTDQYRYQAAPNASTLAGVVGTLSLAAIVGALGYNLSSKTVQGVQKSAASKVLEGGKALGVAGGAIRGTKEIWSAVSTGIQTATEYFMDPNPHTTWLEEHKDDLLKCLSEFQQRRATGLFASVNIAKGDDKGQTSFEWMQLHSSLLLDAAIHTPHLEPKLFSIDHRRVLREALSVHAEVAAYQRSMVPRHEPVGVWIYGTAGCGKSVFGKEIIPPLLHSAMKWTGKWTESIYNVPRDPEHKYWDMYMGQPIAYYDDLAQNTDDKDYPELINVISSANCALNMARLDDKVTTFTSRIVIGSSNIKTVAGASTVKDHDAILRRFPIAVCLRTASGKKLDYAALEKDLKGATTQDQLEAVYDKTFSISKLDLAKGVVGERIPFNVFMRSIVVEVKKRDQPHALGDVNEKIPVTYQMLRARHSSSPPGTPIADVDSGEPGVLKSQKEAIEDIKEAIQIPMWGGCNLTPRGLPSQEAPTTEWRGLKVALAALGVGAGVALVAYFIVMLIKNYVQSQVVNFEHKYNEGMKPTKNAKLQKTVVKGAFHTKAGMEKVNKHIVRVHSEQGSSWGIVLDSRHLLTNYHTVRNSSVIRVAWEVGDKCHTVTVPIGGRTAVVKFRGHTRMDAVVIRAVGVNFDGFRSLMSQLRTNAEWAKSKKEFAIQTMEQSGVARLAFSTVVSDAQKFSSECYEARLKMKGSKPGDCGLPYFASDVCEKEFLGIHSAARLMAKKEEVNDYTVFFTPLCREDVQEAMDSLDDEIFNPVVFENEWPEECVITGEGGSNYDGRLHKIGKVSQNGIPLEKATQDSTQLERSPLQHKDWDDGFLPSQKKTVMVEGKPKHPLLSNAQKYENFPCNLSAVMFDRVVEEFRSHVPRRAGKTWTTEQALAGEGETNKIVTTTSAGFITKFVKKAELFDITEQEEGRAKVEFSEVAKTKEIPCYKETFVERFERVEQQIRNAKKPFLLWTSTTKDEMLAKRKIPIAKTRVFECPDVILTLLFRKYFGDFLNYYKSKRGFPMGHAIGIDREVASKYILEGLRNKDRCVDIDYSNFDGTIAQVWFDVYLAVTDHFYGEQDKEAKNARHVLIATLRNSYHIIGDTIYESFQGNKSGNPMTDVFNSVVNSAFIYSVILSEYSTIEVGDVWKYAPFLCYGDDVIMSVNEELEIDRTTFAEAGKKMGFVVTAASKDGKMVPYNDVSETTFLKSSFGETDDGTILFPLPMEVIHRELRWQWKQNRGDNVVLRQRIECALRMAVHHGCEKFNDLKDQIAECGYSEYVKDITYDKYYGILKRKQEDGCEFERYCIDSPDELEEEEGIQVEFQMATHSRGIDRYLARMRLQPQHFVDLDETLEPPATVWGVFNPILLNDFPRTRGSFVRNFTVEGVGVPLPMVGIKPPSEDMKSIGVLNRDVAIAMLHESLEGMDINDASVTDCKMQDIIVWLDPAKVPVDYKVQVDLAVYKYMRDQITRDEYRQKLFDLHLWVPRDTSRATVCFDWVNKKVSNPAQYCWTTNVFYTDRKSVV